MDADISIKSPMLEAEHVLRPRLVSKNGDCLIQQHQLPHSSQEYSSKRNIFFRNWFHLVIEWSWRCVLLLFVGGFVISWMFFGVIYYIIFLISGDSRLKAENKQCIANINGFISAFLFSGDFQQLISHRYRFMTDMCPPAYITLCIQLIFGIFLQTLLAGIIVAKLLRPKKRKKEVRFSRFAVIGPIDENDKRPTLMVRIADIQRKLYLAESHVRLYIVNSKVNHQGQRELIGLKDMNVGYDRGWDRVLLLWPIIIRHIIDEESPLYGITRESLQASDFEIIMTVEGIVEATGMTFQARTSFLPDEILWWHRFVPIISLNCKTNEYEILYNLFDATERIDENETNLENNSNSLDGKEINYSNSSGFI
ncbi:unnamed protein product [Dracunculus medinensis]|uniref:IRK_C domain-containing protein n=1 Tax=Dracunculus medinensis TaxID=318479 RepID=A0A0N4UNR2_DRAME|nr:unnamed protein product [Dracunculus medinensis]